MRKIVFCAIILVATAAGASDLTARQEWQMFLTAAVADGGKWSTEGITRPDAIRLILPCGGRIHWGFPVRVQTPVNTVSYMGTKTVIEVTMAPEYLTTDPVVFDQPGTYILRHGDPGHTMLYVQTTCE